MKEENANTESSETSQPNSEDLQARLLEYVMRPGYQPVKPRVIAKKLGLSKELVPQVRQAVKRLVKQGKVAYGSKHLVKPAFGTASTPKHSSAPKNIVTGTFRRAAAGFGFVRPKDLEVAKNLGEDIYVSEKRSQDAASGDLVAVRLKTKRTPDDRVRGEVVEIVERDTHQFVGVYFEQDGMGFVRIDGKVFDQSICVGDAGAKDARRGDKVVVEMVHFPSHTRAGEAVIVEVLGPRGTPGIDTLSIIREYNLPDDFPEDVLDAARLQADQFDEAITDDRQDFTNDTVVTIDPFDARDFDDAISLKRLENGHWQLGVHIADVSHFVPKGSALEREAKDRATSVYLPDRVIPMLPEIISNNLASLQPHRVRYTKTAVIEFTPDGAPVATELYGGMIKSAHRFNYEEVDDYLADKDSWREKLTPEVFDLVGRMHELAMVLRKRRLEAGSIELTLPEVKIDLDKEGKVSGAHLVKHTQSHQIIEEFMLAANEAVATLFHRKELSFLRRVHGLPDKFKLKTLSSFVRELGIECESLESRFEIKRIVELVRGEPEERAVHYAVLRSMKKAVYSPEVEGHYALNSDHYCHFTSPIRRYPDLTIHRMADDLVRGRTPATDFDQQSLLGEHCSEREQRAESAERELIKVKLLTYMSQRIGEEIDAIVTGVERFGLFAIGTELPAEGLIHISSMQDDNYRFDPNTHSLTGFREGNSYRLGDLIRVEVAHVDSDRRELDFRLVGQKKRAAKKTEKRKTPKRGAHIGMPDGKKAGKKKSGGKKKPGKAKGQRRKR